MPEKFEKKKFGFNIGSLFRSILFRRGQPIALQNAFKNPSKTLQKGVEIDAALGFPAL